MYRISWKDNESGKPHAVYFVSREDAIKMSEKLDDVDFTISKLDVEQMMKDVQDGALPIAEEIGIDKDELISSVLDDEPNDENVEEVVDYEIDELVPETIIDDEVEAEDDESRACPCCGKEDCECECGGDECECEDCSYESYDLDDFAVEESFVGSAVNVASGAIRALKDACDKANEKLEFDNREIDWFQIYRKDVDKYLDNVHKKTLFGLHPWDVIEFYRGKGKEDALKWYNDWQEKKYGDVLEYHQDED